MLYAKQRLLSAIWILAFTMEDEKIRIHGHSRNQNWREKSSTLPTYRLIEDRERNILEVELLFGSDKPTQRHKVINPQHVFSYGLVPDPQD